MRETITKLEQIGLKAQQSHFLLCAILENYAESKPDLGSIELADLSICFDTWHTLLQVAFEMTGWVWEESNSLVQDLLSSHPHEQSPKKVSA